MRRSGDVILALEVSASLVFHDDGNEALINSITITMAAADAAHGIGTSLDCLDNEQFRGSILRFCVKCFLVVLPVRQIVGVVQRLMIL